MSTSPQINEELGAFLEEKKIRTRGNYTLNIIKLHSTIVALKDIQNSGEFCFLWFRKTEFFAKEAKTHQGSFFLHP